MKTLDLPGAILLCVALVVGLTGAAVATDEQKEPPKDCCYDHPNYQGACIVTPGEGETCQSILDYLNAPNTIGKSYCGNTKIRGGWSQIDCPPKEEESAKQQTGAEAPKSK